MTYNKIIHWSIILFGYVAVLYPLWERLRTIQWAFNESLLLNLFPFFGLLAVSLLWLHSISGVFEPWLRKHINFDRFVSLTANLILLSLIAHPLLLFIIMGFNLNDIYAFYGKLYITIGTIGWVLLITYDIGKFLKKRNEFFVKNWNKILIISNIGFLLTFFHSLNLGSDLQSDPLRTVWIFYGITATLAIIYTYAIKRFIK